MNKNGVDVEITDIELEKYGTCKSCKKPGSFKGKMYSVPAHAYFFVFRKLR